MKTNECPKKLPWVLYIENNDVLAHFVPVITASDIYIIREKKQSYVLTIFNDPKVSS